MFYKALFELINHREGGLCPRYLKEMNKGFVFEKAIIALFLFFMTHGKAHNAC